MQRERLREKEEESLVERIEGELLDSERILIVSNVEFEMFREETGEAESADRFSFEVRRKRG